MRREVCSETGVRSRFALCALLLFAALLSGCSVKLVYNNAERLVLWRASDYVDLDRAQKDWARARLRMFFHWHRTQQLPAWAATLREFDLTVQDGIDQASLDAYYARARGWSDEILLKVIPTAAELMATFSDEQVAGLPEAFARANAELNEDYEGLDPAAQRAHWREEVRDSLSDWIGDLTAGQELLLDAVSREVTPDNGAWIRYRGRWQAQLLSLLAERRAVDEFAAAFLALSLERERYYTAEYAEVRERNERAYRRFTYEVLNSLTPAQSGRLSQRLDAIADDFEELAAEAGEAPPDPGPAPVRVDAGT
ncbi:MAG TPA: DUF6279 family lipoprotein [Pseudomonadales bacterium]|nr:DUF6279 family lipoprotein [Pseudomonadales bacterium]